MNIEKKNQEGRIKKHNSINKSRKAYNSCMIQWMTAQTQIELNLGRNSKT